MVELDVKAIAKAGMEFERMRIEAASMNVARINVASSSEKTVAPLFMVALNGGEFSSENINLHSYQKTKTVHQPNHPLANEQGMIFLPDVDLAKEMLTLSSAKRAYEANIKVYNSYKAMSAKALEIGK